MSKLGTWWYWNRPIITTRKKKHLYAQYSTDAAMSDNNKCFEGLIKMKDKSAWMAIKQVINSLEELRKNTWDKDRVNRIIKFLKDNFEVKR